MGYIGQSPAGAGVTSADITDLAIVNADINASAAIAMSKTALVGGTGLTLSTNTLNVDASQTGITSVGALNVGSITSGFTSIDVGSGGLTTTGAIAGGTIDATTDFTIGTTVITDDVITFTPTSSDTVTMTATTNGAFSLVTVDTAAAAANIQITADGTVDIDSAGVLTLDSGAAINIEPASGSAILLDGTISIDAGAVTGATSITSTAFVGDITGDVTGTADTATVATTVTITDNESTDESNAIIFTAGGDVDGGNIGLESDGTLTYNPSTGKITATGFIGALTGNASGTAATVTGGTQASITTVANVVEVGALDAGSITSGFTSIDVGAGAIAGGSFDASDGNITNVGNIALDSISADATDISIAVTDNSATALTVLQGSDAYLIIDTANSSESVSIGTGISGTAIAIGHGTSETTFGDNVTITGDLTINGAQVTNATTNLTIADPLVKYGQAYVGSAYDQGFIVTRGNSSSSNTQNMAFIWDESEDEFATIKAATEDGTTAGNVTVTDHVNLHVGALVANDTSTFSGSIELGHASDTTIARASSGAITVEGTAVLLAGDALTGTTIDASTDFTIGTTVITDDAIAMDAGVITFTPTTSDTVVMTAATNGAFSLVTTDDAAAAANIQITADGTVDIDSAGILTLDSGAAINIEPASGSAILLDGTISIDAGVVTNATSITSTAFVGALTGNADTATLATTVTITDNESTSETNAVIFTAGGDLDGGNLGLESDGDFTYTPNSGTVAATTFSGALSGNATTATALAAGRTISMTGDVAWTSASFDGSGNVTAAGTIQANAVEGSMLNNNTISGQTEITSGLAAADELLYDDGGVIKKIGLDNFVELTPALATEDAVADGDYFLFLDGGASGNMNKEAVHDLATLFAGAGMTATSSVVNVIGGDGITANANDVAITAAQTTVTSMYNAALKIGRDTHNQFDFATDNAIKVSVNAVDDEFRFVAGGDFHADADVIAFSTTIASDLTLKKNIVPISSAMDKVMQLTGVTFDWKREDRGRSAGLIAQDVEKILPQLVKEVPSLKTDTMQKHLNYNGIIGLLVEAVKELAEKVGK